MNKVICRLLRVIPVSLVLSASSVFIGCQNNNKSSQRQHEENLLEIEKAYYWKDIIQACLNSNYYSEALPYLDSLSLYCNYYEEACYVLSHIYLKSSKEIYDEQKGKKFLLQAAYGIPDCEFRLNQRQARGYSGLPRAKFVLALSYLFGDYGIKKDETKGIQLLDTLSKANYAGGRGSLTYEWNGDFVGPKAKIMLATFYENGLMGLPQDMRKAANLWNEALEMTGMYYMDNADLLKLIGKKYKDTNNPYYKDITEWLLNEAKPEEPTTQFLLALCYRFGKGVPKDIRRSNNMLREVTLSKDLADALYPLIDYISGI